MPRPSMDADTVVKACLRQAANEVEKHIKGPVIAYIGPMARGIDVAIRDALDKLHTKRGRAPILCVLLETDGGTIEVVERIVDTLRHHYRQVVFIIPNFAYSAGTVLALSGDIIYMDYFSVLGPIDPQLQMPDGQMVTMLGYLAKYDELVGKSREHTLTSAELTYLVKNFDPGKLYQYERAKELAGKLLEGWLVKFNFRTWKVSRKQKQREAAKIAKLLGDPVEWCSHGRGISMQVLKRRTQLNLKDFGRNPDLEASIARYYDLLRDFQSKYRHGAVLHSGTTFVPFAVTSGRRES
jgi:hypothetical protein